MQRSVKSNGVDGRWKLEGYAILCTDRETGQPYWHTYDNEGEDDWKLSLRQPVIFPTKKLPLNSVIRVYIPRGSDESN
jgi:hypothetical protein